MSSCRSNKDCLSTETCLNYRCEAQSNPSNKLSTGAYVGIGIGVMILVGIVVAICLRVNRSAKKYKSSESQPARSEQGPAPLPPGYKKPVDLLQVAEHNRRMEEAQERKRMQESSMVNTYYQPNPNNLTNVPYVTVPLSQVYVVTPGQNNIQGSMPTLYVDSDQQASTSFGYPVAPQRNSSYGLASSNINAAGPSQFIEMKTNVNNEGKPHVGYNQQMEYLNPVAHKRSDVPL